MWDPRLLTALWASTSCYSDSFIVFLDIIHRPGFMLVSYREFVSLVMTYILIVL
jgi:hypothetical protein